MATATANNNNNKAEQQAVDAAFARQLQNATMTVQAWEDDPTLLQECRLLLPWDELRNEQGKYAEYPRDMERFPNHSNARFVQRLARFFRQDFMTWVNAPPCSRCQSTENMKYIQTRGPETPVEISGGASRVEVYQCEATHGSEDASTAENTTTLFPRFNAPRALLESRQGRCGEYANLFGCFCRAVGLETRYILDVTDHVWTEVRVPGMVNGNDGAEEEEWLMVDSCEGVVNEPSMYEAGWGKKLSYIIGIAVDHCIDVTWRYTRQGLTDEFMARRRQYTSSEVAGEQIIQQYCQKQWQSVSGKAREEMQKRVKEETHLLESYRNQLRQWNPQQSYGQGRISGSLEWKVSRKEAGKQQSNGNSNDETTASSSQVSAYSIETFFPLSSTTVSIAVQAKPNNPREAIIVSSTPCAVGRRNTLSVVVVDETCLGCILQSRGFASITELVAFLLTVPDHRIVVVQGKLETEQNDKEQKVAALSTNTSSSRSLSDLLPGFVENFVNQGILYMGQKSASPSWMFCSSFLDCPADGHQIELDSLAVPNRDVSLRTLKNVCPKSVIGRVPGDWSNASETAKRQAFLSYHKDMRCSGYTTKPGLPIYLLGETAFPLEKGNHENSSSDANWNTFLWYPTPMVPESDHGIGDTPAVAADKSLMFQVPVDMDFFQNLVGPTLRTKSGPLATSAVLENKRLVGLYFSAHWCGPCRSLTPVLAEMYETLRDAFPSHGLEIIFVSSDRDANSFDHYYSTMPWTAIPFDNLQMLKASLSMQYGVRGIPFLVVLDAVSGQIVVPGSSSRQEVMGACRRGDAAIEQMFKDWIERLPAETKEIMSMLEVSCNVDRVDIQNEDSGEETGLRYLQGADSSSPLTPNWKFKSVPLSTAEEWEMECLNRVLEHGSNAEMRQVIETAIKYIENAKKQPWMAKFRTFRLSNKVADRITRVPHGVSFLESVGLEVLSTKTDFYMTIPLAVDLDDLQEDLSAYLEEYSA